MSREPTLAVHDDGIPANHGIVPYQPLPQRIIDKIDVGDCWEWTGAKARGYGYTWYEGKVSPAHRVVYELLVGGIPDGLQIDHLCRNPPCVNPDHLEPVTSEENTRRGIRRRKGSSCVYGHTLSGDNLYIYPKSKQRGCRACARRRNREYSERKRSSSDAGSS